MRRYSGLGAVLSAAGLAAAFTMHGPSGDGPRYDSAGRLLLPKSFETWVFVGTSIGLTYAEEPPSHEMFHNVYLEPSAHRHYVETGRFPEGTMLAMTLYGVEEKKDFGSGRFSGEFHGLELAVKDRSRFAEGWAYYAFGGRHLARLGPGERLSARELLQLSPGARAGRQRVRAVLSRPATGQDALSGDILSHEGGKAGT